MELVAVILACFIAAMVILVAQGYQTEAFQQINYKLECQEIASEQVQFAHAVSQYMTMSTFGAGTTLTPQALITAGLLPSGFATTNPVGQTPIAYIGAGNVALVTYTGLPSSTALAGLGINSTSSASMGRFAASLDTYASADAQSNAVSLAAVEINGASASTPYAGHTYTLSTFFTTYPQVTEPMYSELVNYDVYYSNYQD